MKTKGKKVTKKSVPVYNHGGRIRPEDLVVGRSYNYLLEPNTKVKYLTEGADTYIFTLPTGEWVAIAPSDLEDSISMVMENGGSFMNTSGLESQVRIGEKRFEKEVEAIDAFEAFLKPQFKSKFNTDYNQNYLNMYSSDRSDFVYAKRAEFLRLHPEYNDYLDKGGSLYHGGGSMYAGGGKVGGRGWGEFKKGKRITSVKEFKLGGLYLEHSPQFNANNIVVITSRDRTPLKRDIVYGSFVHPNDLKRKEEDFAIWGHDLARTEFYEIAGRKYEGGGSMYNCGGSAGSDKWIVMYSSAETGGMRDRTFTDKSEADKFAESVGSEAIPVKYEKGGHTKGYTSKYEDGGDLKMLRFGMMGNGLTVYDLNHEEHGDYKKVAHINDSGVITWYDKNLSSGEKTLIEMEAKDWKVNHSLFAKGGKFSHYFGKAKEHASKAYSSAKHHGTKAYHATKKYTEDKIHEQKKDIAIKVLEDTRGAVGSKEDAKKLRAAISIVEEKYAQGGKMCPVGMKYQSLIFSKDNFSKAEAIAWAKKRDFKAIVDEKPNSYRMRQVSPTKFRAGSFRTIPFTTGIEAVIGCPARVSGKKVMKKS